MHPTKLLAHPHPPILSLQARVVYSPFPTFPPMLSPHSRFPSSVVFTRRIVMHNTVGLRTLQVPAPIQPYSKAKLPSVTSVTFGGHVIPVVGMTPSVSEIYLYTCTLFLHTNPRFVRSAPNPRSPEPLSKKTPLRQSSFMHSYHRLLPRISTGSVGDDGATHTQSTKKEVVPFAAKRYIVHPQAPRIHDAYPPLSYPP